MHVHVCVCVMCVCMWVFGFVCVYMCEDIPETSDTSVTRVTGSYELHTVGAGT